MSFIESLKNLFKRNEASESLKDSNLVSLESMEKHYEEEAYMEAAQELKILLERYGKRKRKNHRYKGREFIYFILSNKHKNLKNAGYMHWKNLHKFMQLNKEKVYPYHKNNLRNAMDFFEKEVKSLREIKYIPE
jgi:hypothetical protein